MKIYRIQSGQTVAVIEVNKATYTGNAMGERYVTCEVKSAIPLTDLLGCFVELKLCNLIAHSAVQYTERFYVFSDASIKRNTRSSAAGNAYEYTIKMYPEQYKLQQMVEMRDVQVTAESYYTDSSEYALYGNVERLSDGIMAVLNAYEGHQTTETKGVVKNISEVVECNDAAAMRQIANPQTDTLYITKDDGKMYHYHNASFVDASTTWNIFIWEDCIEDDCYDYTFSATKVWNALTLVNNEEQLDLDFVVLGKTICIGFPDRVVTKNNAAYQFKYGTDSLFKISKSVNDSRSIVNRLRAYGSTKNVARYYNSIERNSGRYVPRLMLPSFSQNGIDYVQNAASIAKYAVREGTHNFEDIYPTIQNVKYGDFPNSIYTIKTHSNEGGYICADGYTFSYDSQGQLAALEAYPSSSITIIAHDKNNGYDYQTELGPDTRSAIFAREGEGGETIYLENTDNFTIVDVHLTGHEGIRSDDDYWYAPFCYKPNKPSGSDDHVLNEILAVTEERNEDDEITQFFIYTRDLGFNILEEYVTGYDSVWMNDGTPKFNILDGLLGGLDFELVSNGFERLSSSDSYYAIGARFKFALKPNTQNEYDTLPNNTIKCHAGDHFSIYSLDMPNLYVYWAEQRLQVEAEKELADLCFPEYKYDIEFDKIALIMNPDIASQLREGAVMRVYDEDLVTEASSHYVDLPIQSMNIEFNGDQIGYNVEIGEAEASQASDITEGNKSSVSLAPQVEASTWSTTLAAVSKTSQQVSALQKSSATNAIAEHTIFGHTFNGTQDVEGSVLLSCPDNNGVSVPSKTLQLMQAGYVNLDATFVADGGLTAYAEGTQEPGTLLDRIPIDTTTLEVSNGLLKVKDGAGGTDDYEDLSNKPSINNVTLVGNKTLDSLGIQAIINATNKLDYSLINNTPDLSDMASKTWVNARGFLTSVSYDDLTTKPTQAQLVTILDGYYARPDGEYENMYVGHANEATVADEAGDADTLDGHDAEYFATASDLSSHIGNTNNPHSVTKAQIGLGNVENTALSTWQGTNNIVTLGTVTAGVWHGTAIENAYLANHAITLGTTLINLGETKTAISGLASLGIGTVNLTTNNGRLSISSGIKIGSYVIEEDSNTLLISGDTTIDGNIYADAAGIDGQAHVGSLLSDGGITAYASGSQLPGSILDNIPIDTSTLRVVNDVLTVIAGSGVGSVTSVDMTVPTGLQVSGGPIVSSGTLAVTFASGYSIPTTDKQSNWDSAYNEAHSHNNQVVLDDITSVMLTNWDTAYSWGNHASAGYALASAVDSADEMLADGIAANAANVDSLAFSVDTINEELASVALRTGQLEDSFAAHNHDGRYSQLGHTHDDRYYTENEVDSLLAGKSGTSHNHDDRYYTESEMDTLLAQKAPVHSHPYIPLAGSAAITGSLIPSADDAVNLGDGSHGFGDIFLTTGGGCLNWGSGNDVFLGYEGGSTGNLLAVCPGTLKVNNAAVILEGDSRLTNSRPASDVYSWAKAATKPSYNYSEVGAAAASHNHDDRYYTESEMDTLLAQKAPVHSHPYLPLDGGTLSGALTVNGRLTISNYYIEEDSNTLLISGDTTIDGNIYATSICEDGLQISKLTAEALATAHARIAQLEQSLADLTQQLRDWQTIVMQKLDTL